VEPLTTPPTGTGTASVAPDPKQPPKKKKRRLFRSLVWLVILSSLGYGGGVWYSLVSDNFHDFFTEYVPFGEDAVAYFEEREFRKRFPGRAGQPRAASLLGGDKEVTIPGKSGLGARVAEEKTSSAPARPHVNAVGDGSDAENRAPKVGSNTPTGEKSKVEIKDVPEKNAASVEKKENTSSPAPTPAAAKEAVAQIDHLSVPSASEPVVQDVVKIVNDLITVVNADPENGNKYNSALEKAKSDLSKVVNDINLMKGTVQKAAEDEVKAAHSQFDEAARELIKRLEVQMHEQELRYKEEYESERERLSQTYKEKLQAELDAAKQVYEQRLKNELLEQSIVMQKQFSAAVRERVEAEREGRLGKLNELSESVHELERLTAEWNSVVDANLKTQHLVVAVEAVKSALENQTTPKPFITELAALKEIAADDPVVSAAIASINPAAYQRGIPNAGQLIDRFRRVAQEVRKAALLPEDAGVASHLASLAMSKVLFKKSGLAVGQDVEAVLARTEILLEEGDLDGAAREMNGLQGWAKVLSKDWLADCRRVLEVKQALDVIGTEARLQTLLVD
jgi:mitofilin